MPPRSERWRLRPLWLLALVTPVLSIALALSMAGPVPASATVLSGIAWFYFVTNAARVVTYVPQILAVWRCRDGAHTISLLTWGSWVLSHATAMLYGTLVVKDPFFVLVSFVNLVCCGAVTVIAARRRGLLGGSGPARP